MKKQLLTGLLALALSGCVATPMEKTAMAPGSEVELAAAKEKLAMAKKQNAEWKIIDKATGGSAQSLSKLLKVANKKAAEGNHEEAARLAKRVSTFAVLGVEQAKAQMEAKPFY